IAGPGHAALEAIGYTFLRPGDRIVVVSNGFFGDRTHEVLLTHRVKADLVSSAWGSAPDLAALRTALKTPAKAVVVVHNETSTGVTNSLDPIVEAAHAADAFVIVDAVSSLGGLPLPFAKLGIDCGPAWPSSDSSLSGRPRSSRTPWAASPLLPGSTRPVS